MNKDLIGERDWPTELWELFIEVKNVKESLIVHDLQEWIEKMLSQ